MKKILFFSAAAAMMLASCSSEETVQAPKGNAIDFGNAFVNNSTRADFTNVNLPSDFGVYGYMDGVTGIVFDNEKVSGPTWTYVNTQYWAADHNYWFAAIAPYNAATFTAPATLPNDNSKFGTIAFTNGNEEAAQIDLLYANQNSITGKASGNAKVGFTFNHLLARTQFTFKNTATNKNVKFVVSNVKITNAVKDGEIVLGAADGWKVADSNSDLVLDYTTANTNIEVGGEALVSAPKYIIPIAKAYTVTFDVQVLNGDVVAVDKATKTVTIPATVAFASGNSYNFTCALTYENVVENAEPIEFDVTGVTDWNAFGNTDIEM